MNETINSDKIFRKMENENTQRQFSSSAIPFLPSSSKGITPVDTKVIIVIPKVMPKLIDYPYICITYIGIVSFWSLVRH